MTDFGDPFLQRMQRERAVTNTEVVRQIESKEVLAEDWIQRLERVERLLEKFANSQEFVLPRAFQELVERVKHLETAPKDITPSVAVGHNDIQLLAETVSELGAAVSGFLQAASVLEKRADALEARVSSIPRAMFEEYMASLKEIQSRNA